MPKTIKIIDGSDIEYVCLKTDEDIYNATEALFNKIVDEYEDKILYSLIKTNYSYMTKHEQMFIGSESKKKLVAAKDMLRIALSGYITDYIKEERLLNMAGFITFRLKEYVSYIEDVLAMAVNEFIMENEYKQLIDGLSIYTELQIPLIDLININQINDRIRITDLNQKEIFSLVIGFEDILLDVILTLSPQEIIIYNDEEFTNKEIINTIIKIYNNRVKLKKSHFSTSKGDKE